MSGTLIVQNLQGPASGANANKIIVPAGQVLDASAGTFTPSAGQVVQVKYGTKAAYTSTTTASYVATGLYVDITPKFANSIIHLQVNNSRWWDVSDAAGNYLIQTIYRDAINIGVGYYSSLAFNGATGEWDTYDKTTSYAHVDSPLTTSTIRYEVYFRLYSALNVGYVNDAVQNNMITATEIKQ
jgi:hypothetical protein